VIGVGAVIVIGQDRRTHQGADGHQIGNDAIAVGEK